MKLVGFSKVPACRINLLELICFLSTDFVITYKRQKLPRGNRYTVPHTIKAYYFSHPGTDKRFLILGILKRDTKNDAYLFECPFDKVYS